MKEICVADAVQKFGAHSVNDGKAHDCAVARWIDDDAQWSRAVRQGDGVNHGSAYGTRIGIIGYSGGECLEKVIGEVFRKRVGIRALD